MFFRVKVLQKSYNGSLAVSKSTGAEPMIWFSG